MEREKPYIPPMSGQEVVDMFGNKQLLKLEEEHKRLADHLSELSKQLAEAKESVEPETDDNEEEKELLEIELRATRDKMREHDREVRKVAQDFGNLRGPVTLR